jgi:hypothetical protein
MFSPHGIRQMMTAMGRWLAAFLACVWLLFTPTNALASIAPEHPFPIASAEWQGQYARIPDWSQMTLRSLPPIQQAGEFVATPDLNQALGYDFSRQWQAGQSADSYLRLGDFQTSLYLQLFNLYAISQLTKLDLKRVALSALEMIAWQTIYDLVTEIPELGNRPVSEISPIQALLEKNWSQSSGTVRLDPQASLAELLRSNPELGNLNLGQLGKELNQFAITDIPGLENVPLQNFANWENSFIKGVPGLADVAFSQMPNPVESAGMIGTVDVVYSPAEGDRTNTISGSHEAGFAVPCKQNCAHIELAGTQPLYGKQWISGQFQQVKGGFGILGAVNGGLEPTGRHPFGDGFKVSIWDVDESTGSLSTALHFRICKRGIPDLGCTPYFIGPVPFLNFHEKEPIFTGFLDSQGGTSSQATVPASVVKRAKAMGIPASARPGASPVGSLCGGGPSGVDFKALAAAFSSIEGNYRSVGSFVCDGDGNCGRGLGRYQYMSYRSDVRAAIRKQSGGAAFLARVDAGTGIGGAEMERLFPSTQQDALFKADQTQNIRQAMREGFSGGRLIERVGQIHFGGPGAPIDGGASDIHGRLTLKTYGQELRASYERATRVAAGKSCPPQASTSKRTPKHNPTQKQSGGR